MAKRGHRSFIPTLDRGEYHPKCKYCGTLVPVSLWWEHVCKANGAGLSSEEKPPSKSGQEDGEQK